MFALGLSKYLVSMLGADVAWVRNVKAAAGHAVRHHGRAEQVRLAELAIEKRAPVLKAYFYRRRSCGRTITIRGKKTPKPSPLRS